MSGNEREPSTSWGEPVKRAFGPDDAPDPASLGAPGEFPFTRGIHAAGYRSRLWTMRQYAGFGSAAETNKRYRFLLDQGQTGLSVAFDLPTQMGHDPDAPSHAARSARWACRSPRSRTCTTCSRASRSNACPRR